jgi:hypothetical protein
VRSPTVNATIHETRSSTVETSASISAEHTDPVRRVELLDALVGPVGRTLEACGADIADVGEEHGHRVLRVQLHADVRLQVSVAVRRLIGQPTVATQSGHEPTPEVS